MCLEEFETMDELISHKTNVHKRIQCTHCPDVKLVVDLNKHLKNTHGILQNSMCEHCGQVYTNTRSLQVDSIVFVFRLEYFRFIHVEPQRIRILELFKKPIDLISGSHSTET